MATFLLGKADAKSTKGAGTANKSENLSFKENASPQFTTSENVEGSVFEDAGDIKSKFINQEQWKFKSRQQSSYEDRYSEFLHGRNTQAYQTCPAAEMYIGVVMKGQYDKFEVKDIEIRRRDRTQFVTGMYTLSSVATSALYDVESCFIARITTRGDYEKGSYLFMDNNHDSSCYNLALIPRINYLVTVGYVKQSGVGNNKRALIYLTDQDLVQKALKVWTYTNDAYGASIASEATDVQVADADGSIYVTGNIENSFTINSASKNCFVMRVDTELNLIYAKSFGDRLQASGAELYCYSLQITRNADFMYFGGHQTYGGITRLFFSKSNGNGDFMVTTAVEPNTASDQFSLSRILLDKGNPFTTSSDTLYFCGTLTYSGGTNSDFMYGYITSGDVETFQNETAAPFSSALIKVEKIYTYGTPNLEKNSDCAISDDNKNLMVVFSTNYHNTVPGLSRIWTWPDDTVGASKGLSQSYDFLSNSNPFTLILGGTCGSSSHHWNYANTYSSMELMLYIQFANYHPDQRPLIRAACEDPIKQSIIDYATIYEKQLFSWHECTNYWWAFSAIDDCQINKLTIDDECNNAANSDFDDDCSCGCPTWYTSQSTSCAPFLGWQNQQRPWYTDGCYRQEQRRNIYRKVLAAQDQIRQFMYCYDSDTPSPTGCTEDDEFFLNFEQDCLLIPPLNTIQSKYSIFVARFTLSDISSALHVNSNPSIAAYLGEKSGNLFSYSIALDQYGFVYVHALSDAPGYGAQPTPSLTQNQNTWVHVKTHWEIGGEYEFKYSNYGTVDYEQADLNMGVSTASSWTQWFGRSSDYTGERPPSFISKKFTVPKKFQNNANLGVGEAVTFLRLYNLGAVSNPLAKAYMMNEELYDQNTYSFSFSLTNIGASSFIWGYSYAKASKTEDIHLFVDSTNALSSSQKAVFNVPHICVSSLYGISGTWFQNYYREGINGKNSWRLSTSTLLPNFVLANSGYYTLDSYTGSGGRQNKELAIEISGFNTLSEGLYYFDVRVATDDRYPWDYSNKHCQYTRHGFFWNTDQFSSNDFTYIRRFEASYRVRILIDYETVTAPANIKNIEDIFPVVGLKSELALNSAGVSKYFEGCDRYYAKQQKLKITQGLNTFYTEALPHWIKFFERNATFQFYPIIYSPSRIISLELSCCNQIEQCATQTFHVDVKNTPPVSDFAQINTYVLQYDAVEFIGQQFQWEMRNTYFYDVDKASDSLNATTYNNKDTENVRTDHTVDMDFPEDAALFYSNQFRHIKRLGLIFGQGSSTIYGIKLLKYEFRDNFITTTPQLGQLKVLINKMPTVTSNGKNDKLTQIDPKQFGKTTYFDKWFPFLNNDDLLVFEVDTSIWFTDDSTDILTYGLTRSDNTPRPNWIDFDVVSGKMTGFPNQTEKSELLQLKFTVQDQQQGTNKVYKEMLINTKPRAANLYKVLEVGINRQFAYNVSELIWDYNGDQISFSLPQSQDQVKLAAKGISFSDATKLIYGKPALQGIISLIKLRGTDTHGSYVDVYITIKIDDYQPNKRSNVRYADRQIYEYQRFEFKLDDSLFYDQKEYATLVLFAYDPAEQPLPSWLNFMPHSRIFNGIAPKRNTEQVVVIRALNTITHDSLSVTFRIQVIPNPSPKTRLNYMPDDLTIVQDSWIDHQVPIMLFKDNNDNYMPQLEILPVNGAKFPSFLKFNPTNRTIFGKANETGSFVVDFLYQDDQGRKTYSNLRITVTPVDYSLPNKYYYHFGISGSAFLAILIFIGYVYHTNSLLSENYKVAENTEKDAAEARKRFGEYREIDVKFKKPQPRALDHIRQARLAEKIKYAGGEAGAQSARTFDYNFIADDYNNSPLENTITTILNKNSGQVFKYQDRWDDSKPNETLSHRVSMQQRQLRRKGQKTKISSL